MGQMLAHFNRARHDADDRAPLDGVALKLILIQQPSGLAMGGFR